MSWVDKELKRRAATVDRETANSSRVRVDSMNQPGQRESISRLWEKFESANDRLPIELRLQRETNMPSHLLPDSPPFIAWLMAENGAALGFNGEGIRYLWPETNPRKSNNFWIRCSARRGLYLIHRVESFFSGNRLKERRFNEARVDHVLKCLVTGVRVTPSSVGRRRFLLF